MKHILIIKEESTVSSRCVLVCLCCRHAWRYPVPVPYRIIKLCACLFVLSACLALSRTCPVPYPQGVCLFVRSACLVLSRICPVPDRQGMCTCLFVCAVGMPGAILCYSIVLNDGGIPLNKATGKRSGFLYTTCTWFLFVLT